MTPLVHQKVTAGHLQRLAYLYIRQSSLRQVLENTESTARQYALRERAVALGWAPEQLVVIDGDQGQSGAATDRAGFQTLVAEVGLGRVGIVLGLEVSRLARNNADWHRLLELCALTRTLILDEDGVYDPAAFNDRLLLGLKGTMSEAELHVLRARLRGGLLTKASRGALKVPLPVGFVYRDDGQVVLDPDQQVQRVVRLFFQTFRRTGSAYKTVQVFREQGLRFPHRVRAGPRRGELTWGPLQHCTALHLLHNPRYAGAFAFGRHQVTQVVAGRPRLRLMPRDRWHVLLPGAHDGYITWEEYEGNLRRLGENAQAHGDERRQSPPREGPALLQGLAICGRCGERMTVRYHARRQLVVPEYVCQRDGIAHGRAICQQVLGTAVDAAIGDLLVATMTPLTLEVALAVQAELTARAGEADRLRCQQVERARYEAELAQRRFLRVDPANRLVADVLEADWNAKLQALAEAQAEADRHRQAAMRRLDADDEAAIQAVATDFPRLWHDPRTPQRERKRMVRLLLEDVTLLKADAITVQVRFRGGATRTLTVPGPQPLAEQRRTERRVVDLIDALLDRHTDGEIAALLNAQGYRSHDGHPFQGRLVARLRRDYRLRDRFSRLRAAGLLSAGELAARLGVSTKTVAEWRDRGVLSAHRYNDKGSRLYEMPAAPPTKWARKPAPRPNLPS